MGLTITARKKVVPTSTKPKSSSLYARMQSRGGIEGERKPEKPRMIKKDQHYIVKRFLKGDCSSYIAFERNFATGNQNPINRIAIYPQPASPLNTLNTVDVVIGLPGLGCGFRPAAF